MKILVYLRENDGHCFEDVVTAFQKDKKELVRYVKETIKNDCSLDFEYETEWDTFYMRMAIGFFNEIDETLVRFLTREQDQDVTTYILDIKELA